MPVKYGPEGYSSPNVRRFQERQAPEIAIADLKKSSLRRRNSRRVGVALGIVAITIAAFYFTRPSRMQAILSATAVITAKDTRTQAGGAHRVLEIGFRSPDGARHSVTLECDEQTWHNHKQGDKITVRYRFSRRDGRVTVTEIGSTSAPVEL